MKNIKSWLLTISLSVFVVTFYSACSDGGGVNLFSLSDDKELGKQTRDQILANPTEYSILDEAQYPAAYAHLRRIRDRILNGGAVNHRSDFDWEVYIIHDDATLNAFCVPGGYIFVYTGIIKYLDTEDDFAGVLGHEIAHADLRHSTDAMTTEYGLNTLLSVVLGSAAQSTVTQISASLLTLSFSRANETQADKYSVKYLCNTGYASNGAAGFFQKLIDSQQAGNTPAFLSTHPNPDNRVGNINAEAANLGCSTTPDANAVSTWANFKASIPQ